MEEELCEFCGHPLKENNHGLDQNDFYYNDEDKFVHSGHCTYCKECNSIMNIKE